MKSFCIFVFLLWVQLVQAGPLPHEASSKELQELRSQPDYFTAREYLSQAPDWTPVHDTADFKYVLFSSESFFSEASQLRYTIAQNLPEGVKLVILVEQSGLAAAQRLYSKYISLDRVIFATDRNIANGFWARDAFPYPVLNAQKKLSLVSARYYRSFGASDSIAKALNLSMSKNSFTFVGGNLLADENGHCFSIDSERMFNTTGSDIYNAYGCKTWRQFEHLSGIGDVDEVIKPLGKGRMLTNTPAYVQALTEAGYQVTMLPAIPNSYRTYANSLIVGQTIFMPTYGVSTDEEAKRVYESFGYKVVGIRSNTLSDTYHGSIHCQTMAYPAISEEALLKGLGLEKLN